MRNSPQFWNVIGSIAIFTVVISVFGALGLLVGDNSFWGDALVSVEVIVL